MKYNRPSNDSSSYFIKFYNVYYMGIHNARACHGLAIYNTYTCCYRSNTN